MAGSLDFADCLISSSLAPETEMETVKRLGVQRGPSAPKQIHVAAKGTVTAKIAALKEKNTPCHFATHCR
jgi:hypothetical protein